MSDSTSILDTIAVSQASKEVTANAWAEAAAPAFLFAKRDTTTAALTWGFYGGRIDGTSVANGTVALTASNTNYVVAHRTTYAVTASTSNTNWNNVSTYGRLYLVVAGVSAPSTWQDHRFGTGGILTPSGAAPSGSAGGDLTGTYPNPTVATNKVTNAQAAQMTSHTWKGNATGSTANAADNSMSTLASELGVLVKSTESFIVACSDESTALTTGTAKVTLRMPYAFTVTEVRASLSTAQTSGSIFTVDINEAGTTIISTKLTIDNTEKTSTTAATPAVISDASLADDSEITFDIDQIGDGTAKGLKVYLIGHRT